ncbi:MAG TPA: rod shape-determining protein MreC [Prevotellaceae bacterium]|nr:rod shape-determining protein MreC [Prevotellaceae bacterium]HBE55757.1 rod shape-determining protein MreC [Prevotellaceae bacterium]
MGELAHRILRHIHWGVFLLLEVFSGWLLFRFNTYHGSVWFTQANSVAAMVMEQEEKLLSYMHLARQNEYLTRQNVVLQYNMSVMRAELDSLRHKPSFTEQEEAKVTSGMRLIPAKVVANSINRKDNYLTINAGRDKGVSPEMGVVSGTGVVGIVSRVTDHYALVMSVLNSQSNISCRLRGTGHFGYLKWNGGNPLHACMDDVPRHAQVRKGDIVETSGFSNVFPPGLFVGRVAQVNNSPDGMAYRLDVQMSTDLSCLRDVCVVDYQGRAEMDSLNVQQ